MNKLLPLLTLLAVVMSATALTLFALNQKKSKEIYFVNNGKLYDGFTLKKEYEKQIQNLRIHRKNVLDSIEFTISKLETVQSKSELEYAKAYYVEKVNTFQEEENNLLSEYNTQIWNRLNTYAAEYSKSKGIDLLFGASGNGTLLYADNRIDITEELIKYANSRYDGK